MLRNDRITVLEGTPAELLQQLQAGQAQDADAEAKLKTASNDRFKGCMMVFFGVFFAVLTFGISLLLSFYGAKIFRRGSQTKASHGALDVDNDKLASAEGLLRTLQVDLEPERPLKLTLDFRDMASKPFLQKSEKVGGGFLAMSSTHTLYEQEWMVLEGALQDGTRLRLSVTRKAKERRIPKRKYTKVKQAFLDFICLDGRLSPERYPNLAQVSEHLGPPPLGMALRDCRCKDARLQMSLATGKGSIVVARYGTSRNMAGLATPQRLHASLVYMFRGLKAAKKAAIA